MRPTVLVVAAAIAGILLFLLATASANTPFFARNYTLLLGLNGVIALGLASLVFVQLRGLWQEYRSRRFGSRLKLRLMAIVAELTPLLADVVARGVSLYFVTEFELAAPRWYWLDEEVVTKSLTYRLSYQSLTRQYRLTSGALHQNFGSLEEALRTMLRIRNWSVVERGALRIGRSYNAALRFRLDVAELPKPLQVSALGRKDWNLRSDWYRWTFAAGRDAR